MKTRSLLFFLLFHLVASATPSIFFEGTWEQARAKAKKENKFILLDCWTENCGYCKMMDDETFVDSAVVDFMGKNFIAVSRDMERGEGRLLNMKYHTQGYPTYYIFTSKGEICYELVGYMKPQLWIDTLTRILRPEGHQTYKGFNDKLEPGYPEFYKTTFGVGNERVIADSAVVSQWLDKQPDLSSEICWGVLWLYRGSVKHQQWILDNRMKLYALYGEQVWHSIYGIIAIRCYLATKAGNDSLFEENIALADVYLPEPYRSERMLYGRSQHYQLNGKWKQYALLHDADFRKNNFDNPEHIHNVSWDIYENSSDTTTINLAIGWVEIIMKADTSWELHDTYACLLFKAGRLDESEAQAEMAIEMAGKKGLLANDTRDLLERIREKKKAQK